MSESRKQIDLLNPFIYQRIRLHKERQPADPKPADPVTERQARRGRARREVEEIEAERLRRIMDMTD